MGIQDRDYYHDRHCHHAGVTDRRDYSQRLRDMEDAGQTINIPTHKSVRRRFKILDKVREPAIQQTQQEQPVSYSVAILLVLGCLSMLGFFAYKVLKALF